MDKEKGFSMLSDLIRIFLLSFWATQEQSDLCWNLPSFAAFIQHASLHQQQVCLWSHAHILLFLVKLPDLFNFVGHNRN